MVPCSRWEVVGIGKGTDPNLIGWHSRLSKIPGGAAGAMAGDWLAREGDGQLKLGAGRSREAEGADLVGVYALR